jgi:hypothetical protein
MQRRQTVDWIVLAQPIEVDEDDIARFAKLYPINARPVESRDRCFILSSGPRPRKLVMIESNESVGLDAPLHLQQSARR